MVSRFWTGATGKRPSSSWHTLCRLLDAANLATLLTVAHTPPLCMKGIQTPSVLRDTYKHVPPHTHTPTRLSATPFYWFPPRSDFPRAVSHGSSFLTNYPVRLMASSPELQPLQKHFPRPSVSIKPPTTTVSQSSSAFGTEYLATSMDSESFGTAHLEQSV